MVFNFRRITLGEGPLSLAGKHLFRAGVGSLTHQSLKYAPQFRKLGVTTIIDLRAAQEMCDVDRSINLSFQSVDLHSTGIDIRSYPLFGFDQSFFARKYPREDDYLTHYVKMVEAKSDVMARIIHDIEHSPAESICICCQAGKDRTGVVSALVQLRANVPIEMIADEFSATSIDDQALSLFEENWRRLNISKADYRKRFFLKPLLMLKFLGHFQLEYNDIVTFLSREEHCDSDTKEHAESSKRGYE